MTDSDNISGLSPVNTSQGNNRPDKISTPVAMPDSTRIKHAARVQQKKDTVSIIWF